MCIDDIGECHPCGSILSNHLLLAAERMITLLEFPLRPHSVLQSIPKSALMFPRSIHSLHTQGNHHLYSLHL